MEKEIGKYQRHEIEEEINRDLGDILRDDDSLIINEDGSITAIPRCVRDLVEYSVKEFKK